MNVICNNCCGGWLYTHNNMEYTNPFMWSITQYDSLIYLLEHFKDINWAKITLSESPIRAHTYQIIVDNRISIHYIHCLFNKDKSKPTKIFRAKIGNDIDYCKIWEYVYNKYLSRVKRMINNGEPPVFLLVPNAHTCNWSVQQMNYLLSVATPFKRIMITTDISINSDIERNLVIHTPSVTSNSQVITDHLETINRFIDIA